VGGGGRNIPPYSTENNLHVDKEGGRGAELCHHSRKCPNFSKKGEGVPNILRDIIINVVILEEKDIKTGNYGTNK
jgi:hypothetical protein